MAACTNTSDKSERMAREPIKYWNYVEEESEFVKEKDDEGKIYYWNYRGEE